MLAMADDPVTDAAAREAARDLHRARFERLVARPEPEIDLAVGALIIAGLDRPLEHGPWLGTLDDLAARVRLRSDLGDDPGRMLELVHDTLYRELGFRGPGPLEPTRPRHSWLDRVLTDRVGLPILLAIVELEVAWRLGLTLWGIGFPGHFLLGGPDGLVVDPADGGRTLTRDDCQALLRRTVGERVLLHAGMLRPVARREILARVLRNLRSARLAARDWPAALGVVELLAVVEPTRPDHVRDRGLLLGRMGRFTPALTDLGRYLEERPDATDVEDVRQVIGIFGGRRN
jgi:regulator of sirC expression with transglutaminase-like and TPR domain